MKTTLEIQQEAERTYGLPAGITMDMADNELQDHIAQLQSAFIAGARWALTPEKTAQTAEEILKEDLHEGDMGSKLFAYCINKMEKFADSKTLSLQSQLSLAQERMKRLVEAVEIMRLRENAIKNHGSSPKMEYGLRESKQIVDELIQEFSADTNQKK